MKTTAVTTREAATAIVLVAAVAAGVAITFAALVGRELIHTKRQRK